MSDKHPAERLFGCMWAVLNRRHVSQAPALAIKTAVETAASELGFTLDSHDNLLDLMAQFKRDGTSKFHGDMTRLIPGLRKIRAVFIEHGLGENPGHGKHDANKKDGSSTTGARGKSGYQHMPPKPHKPGAKPPRFPSSTVEVQKRGEKPKTVEVVKRSSTGNHATDPTPTQISKEQVGHVSPDSVPAPRHDGLPQPTRMIGRNAVWEC